MPKKKNYKYSKSSFLNTLRCNHLPTKTKPKTKNKIMFFLILGWLGIFVVVVVDIVVSIIRYAIRIVLCVKSSVSYRRIVSVHESYDTVCVSYESYRIVKLYVLYYT